MISAGDDAGRSSGTDRPALGALRGHAARGDLRGVQPGRASGRDRRLGPDRPDLGRRLRGREQHVLRGHAHYRRRPSPSPPTAGASPRPGGTDGPRVGRDDRARAARPRAAIPAWSPPWPSAATAAAWRRPARTARCGSGTRCAGGLGRRDQGARAPGLGRRLPPGRLRPRHREPRPRGPALGLRRPRRPARPAGPHEPVAGVAYSPDGLRLASGGNDGTVRIWDPASGEQLHLMRYHQGHTYASPTLPSTDASPRPGEMGSFASGPPARTGPRYPCAGTRGP